MKLDILDSTTVYDGVPMVSHIWYAQSEDFPIAAQGDTAGEVADKLREAVRDHLSET